jgi:hypothetical protein
LVWLDSFASLANILHSSIIWNCTLGIKIYGLVWWIKSEWNLGNMITELAISQNKQN